MNGLILFAHGARDPRWAEPFERVASLVRELRPDVQVGLAFLELMSPDLPSCAATLVRLGCQKIDVLPLFLGAGGHVRKDLPTLLDGLRIAHPELKWRLHRAAGESDLLVQALAQLAAGLPEVADGAIP